MLHFFIIKSVVICCSTLLIMNKYGIPENENPYVLETLRSKLWTQRRRRLCMSKRFLLGTGTPDVKIAATRRRAVACVCTNEELFKPTWPEGRALVTGAVSINTEEPRPWFPNIIDHKQHRQGSEK
jgi:hypothetical protein